MWLKSERVGSCLRQNVCRHQNEFGKNLKSGNRLFRIPRVAEGYLGNDFHLGTVAPQDLIFATDGWHTLLLKIEWKLLHFSLVQFLTHNGTFRIQ